MRLALLAVALLVGCQPTPKHPDAPRVHEPAPGDLADHTFILAYSVASNAAEVEKAVRAQLAELNMPVREVRKVVRGMPGNVFEYAWVVGTPHPPWTAQKLGQVQGVTSAIWASKYAPDENSARIIAWLSQDDDASGPLHTELRQFLQKRRLQATLTDLIYESNMAKVRGDAVSVLHIP